MLGVQIPPPLPTILSIRKGTTSRSRLFVLEMRSSCSAATPSASNGVRNLDDDGCSHEQPDEEVKRGGYGSSSQVSKMMTPTSNEARLAKPSVIIARARVLRDPFLRQTTSTEIANSTGGTKKPAATMNGMNRTL